MALALELDPELGSHLTAQERESAAQSCRVNVVHVAPGVWTPQVSPSSSIFSLVLLEGILLRETALGRHTHVELLTAGDVVLPPTSPASSEESLVMPMSGLFALNQLRVMVLGPEFLQAAVRWPALLFSLQERLAHQQTRAAAQSLAVHERRAEHRILLMLWLLGERCGRVTPDGLLLPLEFTHMALGRLIAARRPTVSLALKQLETDGLITLRADGRTVITSAAMDTIKQLTATDRAANSSSWTLATPR